MMSTPATTPIGDHILTRADGRRVAWSEWGRAKGPPVLLHHRNPGSRLFDPDSAATGASELRLLTVDRPGYGGTDPVVDPTAAAASSDVASVAGELGLDQRRYDSALRTDPFGGVPARDHRADHDSSREHGGDEAEGEGGRTERAADHEDLDHVRHLADEHERAEADEQRPEQRVRAE